MNFLFRLRESINRFMYGRLGLDNLGIALLALSFLLNLVARIFWRSIGGVFSLLALLAEIYFFFRLFSKNLPARYNENARFMSFWNKLRAPQKGKVIKICPSCNAQIRLPKKRGKHSVTCPRCKTTFQVKI